MSASHAIFSFTVFAGLILAGDYVIFHQQNKVLSQTGSEAGSYWDYLSRRLTATRTPEVETRLSDFLPAAAEGWTRAPYVRADGEAVTGRRYIETSLAVDTTNDLLGKLEEVRLTGQGAGPMALLITHGRCFIGATGQLD